MMFVDSVIHFPPELTRKPLNASPVTLFSDVTFAFGEMGDASTIYGRIYVEYKHGKLYKRIIARTSIFNLHIVFGGLGLIVRDLGLL